MGIDADKIKKAVELFLEGIGEKLERPSIKETPERVAKMCMELFAGVSTKPAFDFKSFSETYNGILLIRDIDFFSFCEHHLLPFFGKISIAYLPPRNRIIGVSKFIRVLDVLTKKLQTQERLTQEILSALESSIKPKGVLVYIEAQHLCMVVRGVKKINSKIITLESSGILKSNINMYRDVMALLRIGSQT